MTSQDAGLLLARLLSEPGRARRQWVVKGGGGYQEKLVFAAIAQVLVEHLWDIGEADESDEALPRRLKDKVRRALLGQNLTWETLNWLIDAFGLAKSDRGRLVLAMEQAPRSAVRPDAATLPVTRRYRTVSLTEHHWIGADRRPSCHQTTQVLEGTGEKLTHYPYMFDTNTLDVRLVRGARSVGPMRRLRDDVFGVDIELLRPLSAGQTTTLTYESIFSYEQPPEPEFRRAAFEGLESLDIRVEFHPDAIPEGVAFAEWDQLSHHDPSTQEKTVIEDDLSVHRFLRSVNNSIVGFRWQW